MTERLLVVGAGGFLGGWLMRSRDPRFECIGPHRSACDITSPASVRLAFESARPDVAILCAALADIDRCEKNPALARAINVEGAKNVARECARAGTRFLFTSSGAVFDGTAESYYESDSPNPISVYGQSKAEAEQAVHELVPSAVILRLSLVIGASPRGGTNAFLDKLRSAFSKGEPVFAPSEELRNALDVDTLVRWMLDLAAAPKASGVFHLGSSDAISRHRLTLQLAAALGYPAELVIPSSSSPDRAPRGRRHMLVPERIQKYSRVPIPTSMETIERCVHASV